jgi:hypothetical protein
MNRLYVAGPMTGLPELNYPAFHSATSCLRTLGYRVESPATIPPPDSPIEDSGLLWRYYMGLAIPMLLRCDTIVLLDDWEKSRGARLEATIARSLDYETYHYMGYVEGLMERLDSAQIDYVLKYA